VNIKSIVRRLLQVLGIPWRPSEPVDATAASGPEQAFGKEFDMTRTRGSLAESYALLRDQGFEPCTVIDVGVAAGTPDLYTIFPEAYFLLVEPLSVFEPQLQSILETHRGSYVLAAAGAETGRVTFNVHVDYLEGSSLFKEAMGPEADGEEIEAPLVRLDDVVEERGLSGPFLIKVDVQGAELEVLEGAPRTLAGAEAVALEVSLFQFMKGAPEFHDVIAFMKARGFVAFDIVLGWNRPLDNALGQVDIVFVKEDGRFRKDHSFATVKQMKALFRG
jgi:FkbM family methyltransferase